MDTKKNQSFIEIKAEALNDTQYIIQNEGLVFDNKSFTFSDRKIFQKDHQSEDTIVDAACGCAMAVRVDLYKKLGGFNESYYLYNEDAEFSWRYRLAGYSTKFINNAIVWHYHWGSTENISSLNIYYGTRNRLLFIKEYFGLGAFTVNYLRTIARCLVYFVQSFTVKLDDVYYKNYLKVLLHLVYHR